VKDSTKEPGNHADTGEVDVERAHRVGRGDLGQHAVVQAVVMGQEVADGEEHAEGLLHAEEAVEGPFPMELDNGLRRGRGLPLGGDDVLAGVVALGWTGPEQETAMEGLVRE